MAAGKDLLLGKLRDGSPMNFGERLRLSWLLGLPAILAQFSTILMEYIDAGMVGRLGSDKAAAIGLVETSTWIMMGFCMAVTSGFSVQVAQLIGSRDYWKARQVMRKGFFASLLFSCLLALAGIAISESLPRWLGGDASIWADATSYFFIWCAFLPVSSVGFTICGMLQASGNMKVPSIVEVCACTLDVIFNYIFIYKLGMGVKGAAIGTGLATLVTHIFGLWFLFCKCPELNILQDARGKWIPDRTSLRQAFGITGPMWLQNLVMRGAYIASTLIVAPLGTIAITANSFAIIAESFCYMPGYGLEEASQSLVGQSIGARRKQLARQFAFICTGMASVMMTVLGILMFIFAPQMMAILTPDPEVIALGAKVLRIEAFAETLYAVSMVGYGSCVGAGDTMVPMLLNFFSMWVVRIGLALILVRSMGLVGYWVAMCIELNVRGIIFFVRLRGESWMKKVLV
ncbi:MAG: MATE family efflux transporter [Bacteroidales bacterium]|nr:MATE family efflux transporter [Bacteroidales bacterium]